MVRRIIWSKRAQADRKDIFSYWNNRNQSKNYSIWLRKQIRQTIITVAEHPYLGSPLKQYTHIRRKLVKDYLIIYEIKATSIVILSIFDTRQHPDKLNIHP